MFNRIIPRISAVCLTLTRTASRRPRSVPDPGVSRRLEIIKSDTPEVVRARVDEQTLEDLEDDFFNVSDIREKHDREMQKIRSKITFSAIKRKHFKKKPTPNMLLWSEKEQIRQLYHTEPENWTVERLASSFPATAEVVKKIVNSSWKPDSPERIGKHDEKVRENWKSFSEGKLMVDEEVRSHLSNFTSRRELVFQKASKVPTVTTFTKEIPETVSKEFISIVKSNASANQSTPRSDKTSTLRVNRKSDTYLLPNDHLGNKTTRRRHMTLDEMRRVSKERGGLLSGYLNEAFLGRATEQTTPIGEESVKGLMNPESPVLNCAGVDEKEGGDNQEVYVPNDEMPRKINIPVDKRVKGKLYRVKNSFFTDDGKFLYRI